MVSEVTFHSNRSSVFLWAERSQENIQIFTRVYNSQGCSPTKKELVDGKKKRVDEKKKRVDGKKK